MPGNYTRSLYKSFQVPTSVGASGAPLIWSTAEYQEPIDATLPFVVQYRSYRDREAWKGIVGIAINAPTEWIEWMSGYRRVTMVVSLRVEMPESWEAFPLDVPKIDVITLLRFQDSLRTEGVVTASRQLFLRFAIAGITSIMSSIPQLFRINITLDALPAQDVAEVDVNHYVNLQYRLDDDVISIEDQPSELDTEDFSMEFRRMFKLNPIFKPNMIFVDDLSTTNFTLV